MDRRRWERTLAYLAAWICSSLFTVLDLWLGGSAIAKATIWFGAHRSPASRQQELVTGGSFGWTVELVSQVTLFVLVCVGLGLVLWLEHHYRTGADKRMLTRRVLKVSVSQLVVAIASVSIIALTWLIR